MTKNKSNKKILRLLVVLMVVVVIFLPFAGLFLQNKDKFLARGYEKQYQPLKNAYYSSQYAKKEGASIIPDEAFESFAAGAFLKGLNPIHIVHDHPPMGRYILSLSIILFDNPQTIILFMLGFSFLGIYLISRLILHNTFLSLVPVGIFANEPLLLGKLVYAPLPEPVHLPFIIFSLYFFMLAVKSKNKILLYSIVSFLLGFVISIRFFVTGGVMVFGMVLFLLTVKKSPKELLLFGLTLPIAILVLLASYTKTMIEGYSILQIFGVQKYILAYHKSAFTNAFSFWDLILFNRWHTWWGERQILSDPQWILFWPISVITSFVLFLGAALRKIKLIDEEKILLLWIGGYCLMLSTGYTSTRYFLPIIPFLYILAVSCLKRVFVYVRNKKTT